MRIILPAHLKPHGQGFTKSRLVKGAGKAEPLFSEPRLSDFSLREKLKKMPWGFVGLVLLLSAAGVALLYSAGGAAWEPWAGKQLSRMIPGIVIMLGIALIDIRFWFRFGYWIYGGLLLLLLVIVGTSFGHVGMGAKRWLELGGVVLQPSEHMKIGLSIALACYFHNKTFEELGNPLRLVFPLALVLIPAVLILLQPNLGTATLTIFASAAVFLLAGTRLWVFLLAGIIAPFAGNIAWNHLHDYQKARLTTFLDPEKDPLGAGYNIIQSKIALGSGGLLGKGFGMGTQSQLNFLPEKHTDFIFVVLGEELGLVGACLLLLLFLLLIIHGYSIALHARHQFGRLLGLGLTTTFFLYVLTNVAMVTGLIPVVGIPLPLISYGGSVMLAFYISCGLLLGIAIHKDEQFGRPNLD